MARNNLQSTNGHQFVIEIGDGATPEVFTRVGLVNTNLSASFTQNVSEDSVPNLDNFDDPYDIVRKIVSRDFSVEGAGKIDARYIDMILDLHVGDRAGQIVNAKFKMLGENGFTLTGPFAMQNFGIDGPYKEIATCQMSWQKAGELTYVKNV
ncbi:phage tail tube protein [Brevundimonas sp. TWP1-2-1b1]|uniref:phage tail tube protein n=1 Tax=unclassified Brevundimonas TaxID=2622653 RepID=UPI003CE8B4B6